MRFAYLFLAFALLTLSAHAHESGESFESVVDGYAVDIGYTNPTPTTEDVVAFDFQLERDGASATFSDVWVKIEDADKTVVFAGGLHNAQFGGTRMSYRFPEAGSYTMAVRYEQGDVALAQVSVPMTVTEAAQASSVNCGLVIGAIILVLGVGAGVLWWRRRSPVSP